MSEDRPGRREAGGETTKRALDRERHVLLLRINRGLAIPMAVLGFVWLVLLVMDLTRGLSPFLSRVVVVIWVLFMLQFVVEFAVAPAKLQYLKQNWLTAIALLLPALRLLSVFRLARALSALRGVRLVRVVSSANRGMRALGRVMGRRGVGYVSALTLLVAVAGAAGMYAFERGEPASTIDGLGAALWWTAMTLTTMGTDYFPRSGEGRLLCLLLAIYGFAVFGYVTATVASFFVARDAGEDAGEIAGARQIELLRRDVAALRGQLDALAAALGERTGQRPG